MKWLFSWPDESWQSRTVEAILSVTLLGITVLWVGALVLLVEKLVF